MSSSTTRLPVTTDPLAHEDDGCVIWKHGDRWRIVYIRDGEQTAYADSFDEAVAKAKALGMKFRWMSDEDEPGVKEGWHSL